MIRISLWLAIGADLALTFSLALPLSAQPVITAGYDLWTTAGEEGTYFDFGESPIPAGVFGPGSKTFADKVWFKGEALSSDPPGLLGETDTIVERLEDAVADGRPIRIRMRALSLRSTEPIAVHGEDGTSFWDVRVSLAEEQPITAMWISAEDDVKGHFDAELGLDLRVTFTHTETGKSFTLEQSQTLRTMGARWIYLPLKAVPGAAVDSLKPCSVRVDGDGDGTHEVPLEGWCSPSRFIPVRPDVPSAKNARAGVGAASSRGYVFASASDPTTRYAPASNSDPGPVSVLVVVEVLNHYSPAAHFHRTTMWIDVLGLCRPPFGDPCDDGNPCTSPGRCSAIEFEHNGRIVRTVDVGTCTGQEPISGTTCRPGICLVGQCQEGTCIDIEPEEDGTTCPAPRCRQGECQAGRCDVTGFAMDGTPCGRDRECWKNRVCHWGVCRPRTVLLCQDLECWVDRRCRNGYCDDGAQTDCPDLPNIIDRECHQGLCIGGHPVPSPSIPGGR
ncbi:MAG: hypothetical protein GY719_37215 [bacterium]|nr:hypothetical protein [bacterium]